MEIYSIAGTKSILNWIHANLQKYLVKDFKNKNISEKYEDEKFQIIIYNTNLIIIKGSISKRIYSRFLLESQELNVLGCDEVGVGDFFGPTVYVSVLFDQKTIDFLRKNPITIKDSKKLKDNEIKNIYSGIKDEIYYKSEIIYDQDVENLNSVEQKVYYHHQNIQKFAKKAYKKVVIDLFTTEKSFFKYSLEMKFKWEENLVLETKADSKYLTVGVASIIARAIFLEEIAKLEQKYKMKFPLGAGNVIETAKDFIEKYSKEELQKFAKISFKTFDEL